MISTDERASLLGVIEQEKRSVAYYAEKLQAETRPEWVVRWRGLKAYHAAQIKRRRKELRHAL
jgi:hypothetical protein